MVYHRVSLGGDEDIVKSTSNRTSGRQVSGGQPQMTEPTTYDMHGDQVSQISGQGSIHNRLYGESKQHRLKREQLEQYGR